MKKILFILLAVLCSVSAFATAEYPFLVIRHTDGSETIVSTPGLRFTINDGSLSLISAEGNHSFEISKLSSMTFSKGSSAITDILSDNTAVVVFDATGRFIGSFESASAARRAISNSGFYIFKSEKANVKLLLSK